MLTPVPEASLVSTARTLIPRQSPPLLMKTQRKIKGGGSTDAQPDPPQVSHTKVSRRVSAGTFSEIQLPAVLLSPSFPGMAGQRSLPG